MTITTSEIEGIDRWSPRNFNRRDTTSLHTTPAIRHSTYACVRRVISDSIDADRGNVASVSRRANARSRGRGDEAFSDSEIDGIARNP